MVISSDFLAGFQKQAAKAHRRKTQQKHGWQPKCEIHRDTPYSCFL
jgi:hypothetical protein